MFLNEGLQGTGTFRQIFWKSLSLEKTEGKYLFFFPISPTMDCLLFSNTHTGVLLHLYPFPPVFPVPSCEKARHTNPKTQTWTQIRLLSFLHVPWGIVQPFFPPVGCHCLKAGLDHHLGKVGSLSSTSALPADPAMTPQNCVWAIPPL